MATGHTVSPKNARHAASTAGSPTRDDRFGPAAGASGAARNGNVSGWYPYSFAAQLVAPIHVVAANDAARH